MERTEEEVVDEKTRAMHEFVGQLAAEVNYLKKDSNLFNSQIYDINKQLKKLQYSVSALEKAIKAVGEGHWKPLKAIKQEA